MNQEMTKTEENAKKKCATVFSEMKQSYNKPLKTWVICIISSGRNSPFSPKMFHLREIRLEPSEVGVKK